MPKERGTTVLYYLQKHNKKKEKGLETDLDQDYWQNSPRLWKYQIKRVTALHIKGEVLLEGLLIEANKDLRWEV